MSAIVHRNLFVGTDLVDINRVRTLLSSSLSSRFINRVYTKSEQRYCSKMSRPEIHFAGRFAAKEAVLKAIKSSGYKKIIPFNSINIIHDPEIGPKVSLSFRLQGACKVSISHTNDHALAFAIFSQK